MTTQTPVKSLPLAKDLTKDYPRSPRETLAGFVIAARVLDKCRAVINGTQGEYNFDCPLDNFFFGFAGITADAFKAFVATGADDAAMAQWIEANTKIKNRADIVRWNNQLRDTRLSDLPLEIQVFMEDYIRENAPAGKIVYRLFDVFDLEEKRI